jgi:uncharacterized protein (TIGR00661 family)
MEKELINWHRSNQDITVHCFSDRQQIPEVLKHSRNLYFHKINGTKFLEMMAQCKAVVCTAGFESVCEAMLLSKPVMMIPIPKHFEQACNATDAIIAGAGISGQKFDLSPMVAYMSNHQCKDFQIQRWFAMTDKRFMAELIINDPVVYKTVFESIENYGGSLQPI